MPDSRDDARFVEEHPHERVLPREVREDPFEDDRALEAARPDDASKQNLCHASRREVAHDLVPTELAW